MTEPQPLDLAAVLATLKAAQRHCLPSGLLGDKLQDVIVLIEPHVPPPPDPWLETFDRLLNEYVEAEFRINAAKRFGTSVSPLHTYVALRDFVAAERARTRREP